ncbi:hypothetical protein ACS0TY_026957 [Phlomoides rotata]
MNPDMNILVRRTIVVFSIGLLILLLSKRRRREGGLRRRFTVIDRIPTQIRNLSDLVDVSDDDCRDQLRMDRATFHKLCYMLQSVGGLKTSRRVTMTEKVAMFLSGCLGALDDTFIDVHVPTTDKGRHRNRKGQISVNVLGVCDMNMRFVYVLSGWEGSAVDSRVLRNAITRPNGFKVPIGNYYLCDNGYPNCEGFLTPYKGVRYHLSEWTARRP